MVILAVNSPKGVLQFSLSGTGKTHCARAVANQTDATFSGVGFYDSAGGDNEVRTIQHMMLELINRLDSGFNPRGNIKVLIPRIGW